VMPHDKSWYDPYFINGDQVSIHGRVTSHKDQICFRPDTICNGSKNSYIEMAKKNGQYVKVLELFFGSIAGFTIIREFGLAIISQLKQLSEETVEKVQLINNSEQIEPQTLLRICSKCKLNYKNVVILDCNHFVLCAKCFNESNRVCLLCKTSPIHFFFLKK